MVWWRIRDWAAIDTTRFYPNMKAFLEYVEA